MNANRKSVDALFGVDVQYKVPLYQRRYVWDEASWEVLWKNILDQEEKEDFQNSQHFIGPIVTRLIKGQQSRFEVIDGQQRLMTFQIIFCCIRDLCKLKGYCRLKSIAIDHLENNDITIRDFKNRNVVDNQLPDPIYKFFPSEYDYPAFQKIFKGEYDREIYNAYDVNNKCLQENKIKEIRLQFRRQTEDRQNLLDAYIYFYEKIRKHTEEDLKETTKEKIDNLLRILNHKFVLVQITPGESQQAEQVFESVNATGRQLSEFDYLRNNLFLRASEKSDQYYKEYWIFENDPLYDWGTERLELFFQAFLMAKLGTDVLNNDKKLFDVYQQNLVISKQDVKCEFRDLKKMAETYKMLDIMPDLKSRMQFYTDIGTYSPYKNEKDDKNYRSDFEIQHNYHITIIRSFIMYLQHGGAENPLNEDEIINVLDTLEAYIVRRMLVDTVAGRYAYQEIRTFFNKLFNNKEKKFCIEDMVKYFVEESRNQWNYNHVVEDWFKGKYYSSYDRRSWIQQALGFTRRYIFYRIENWLRQKKKESYLSLEDFPTYSIRVRTLIQLQHDEKAWDSFGNITYCFGEEFKQKNQTTFKDDQSFLSQHGNEKLQLNTTILQCTSSDWRYSQIQKRENELSEAFCDIWKDIMGPWKDIDTRFKINSIVDGSVVDTIDSGVLVKLESGVIGLVRVSEINWTHYKSVLSKAYNEGDKVKVKILSISKVKQRLSLSIKQARPDPWEKFIKNNGEGSIVRGEIVQLTHTRAFAKLAEEVEGFIRNSELAQKRIKRLEDVVSIGDELDLKVIAVKPENREIHLSLKEVTWAKFTKSNKEGSIVRGEIVNIIGTGAFAKLAEEVEGFIHISQLTNKRIIRPEDVVSIGDELDLKVIYLEQEEMKIGLSLKAVNEQSKRKSLSMNNRTPNSKLRAFENETNTYFGKELEKAIEKDNPDVSKN